MIDRFITPEYMRPVLVVLAGLARAANIDAYIVGGTVRDVLLDRRPLDLDLAVARDALLVARRAADSLGGHYVELDAERAVARIVLEPGDSDAAETPERGGARDVSEAQRGARAIAAFCAGAVTPGRRRVDAVAYIDIAQLQGSVPLDMRRRDFTIDSLAVRLSDAAGREAGGGLIDVGGGLADLRAQVVRMNAPDVFDADPLRILRAVRIAAELGFSIDRATVDAIRRDPRRLLAAAGERRRDELARIFALDSAYAGLRQLDALGLLDVLLPEVTAGRGIDQPKEHAYDVLEHNVRTVEILDVLLDEKPPAGSRRWLWDEVWGAFAWCRDGLRAYFAGELSEGRSRASLLKLAGLLHDVAKPQTKELRDGRVRFFGHADAGAEMARDILRRFRFSSKESAFVATLVAEHLRPVQLAQIGEVPTRRALYRFYSDLGEAVPAVLFLSLADAAAARGAKMTRAAWSLQARYMNSLIVRSVEDEGIVHPPRLLTGNDIMSIVGIGEGPEVGRLLATLREAQAAGEVADAEAAKTFIQEQARRDSEASRTSG